jgi:hypothetical protein
MDVPQAITRLLDERKAAQAARLIADAASQRKLPSGSELPGLLRDKLGKAALLQIISAFAGLACFYCRKGRLPCEVCRHEGILEEEEVCTNCIGLGIQRCDFCDGSGQVAIHYVPEGLGPPVLQMRLAAAIQQMKRLVSRTLPPVDSDLRSRTRDLSLLLLTIDSKMGVFENVLVAARDGRAVLDEQARFKPMLRESLALAKKAEARYLDILTALATAHEDAESGALRSHRERARSRALASYYRSLCDAGATLGGSGLEHPFIHRALAEQNAAAAS